MISGIAYYEDRTYNETGFTGTACLPVRYAVVEALWGGATLTATTDATGNFSFTLPAAGTYYIRAITQSGSAYSVTLKDDRDNSIYAVKSGDIAVAAGDTWRVTLSAGMTGAGQVFNIYDNLIKAQIVLKQHSGGNPLPPLTAYWYDGKTTGTYYSQLAGQHRMDILGKPGDSDSYDDSVILHEMGHYAAIIFSKDSSPGGAHNPTGHYDSRLTWSEGWASFFSSVVKEELGEPNPHVYVDTNGGPGTGAPTLGFILDIATPSFATRATGADNELAVANVLWNVYSAGPAPKLGLGFTDIWAIFTKGLPLETYVTFEGFYDHWVTGAGHSAAQLAPLLAARSILYVPDTYEADNSTAAARPMTPGASEMHTFFPAGDADWFKINVTGGMAYTFLTSKLGDSGDTLLTLYDTDGITQLVQNDDEINGQRTSKMSWTAPATKTVHLKVEPYRPLVNGADIAYNSSPPWPPQIVKYGSYTLTVQ